MLDVSGVERRAPSLWGIKRLGRETLTAVLQCSGNGRAFFEHGPSGSQWSVGAAGCVQWTGVRLSSLAIHLGGALSGMKYVTATGECCGRVEEAAVVERSYPSRRDSRMFSWHGK